MNNIIRLGDYITEICEKTTANNQHMVLTSSQEGIVSQDDYFNKQVASKDNTGYKVIRRGQFTYRAKSDTGRFYINRLCDYDTGIVSPAYPVFELKKNEDILPDYLQEYFHSEQFQNSIALSSTGSTRVSLKLSKIADLRIAVPSISDQRHMIIAIQHVSNLISVQNSALCKLDELVKSRFVEMFGKIKHEDSLENLCRFIDYRGKTPEKTDMGLPFITAKNVRMHHMSFETQEFISKETYDKVMTRGFPRVGDVVFTTEAPLGNVCRIPSIDTEFYIGQRIITMQTDSLEPAYLEYALASNEFRKKLDAKASGSTVTGIRSKLLEKLTIPVLPLELQNRFAAFVAEVDKSKLSYEMEVAA